MAHAIEASAPAAATPHLNVFGLEIRSTASAGRGIFASKPILRDTVIEISPVLLFGAAEYQAHGQHTLLDSYTFVWEKRLEGSTMALALGLGSLFNHTAHANVSYELDRTAQCIRYRTVRDVVPGEELCISYGAGRMWWEPEQPKTPPATELDECTLFGQMDLSPVDTQHDTHLFARAPVDSDTPLWRVTASPDPQTMPLETTLAWALNVAPRNCASVARILQTLVRNKKLWGGAHLKHLRTFRKAREVTRLDADGTEVLPTETDELAVLVALYGTQTKEVLVPLLQSALGDLVDLRLYRVRVPLGAAPSRARLSEWSAVWPCVFLPPGAGLATNNALPGSDAARQATLVDRARDKARWKARGATDWIEAAFRRCLAVARHAAAAGEIGSAALVLEPPNADGQCSVALEAHDTRTSEGNPLRHAVPNVVRAVANWRAEHRLETPHNAANGQDYLLTGLSLFLSHEPCVYCAMALIHSRVQTVYFLWPSPHAGGFCGAHAGPDGRAACIGNEDGGPYAIHEQSGLNHRYDVWRWVDPSCFKNEVHGLSTKLALDL